MEFLKLWVLPCLWAALACLGFSLVFNAHGAGVWIACLEGGLGWLTYSLFGYTIPAAFFAAIVIGFLSETMARVRHCPVTCYLVIALLPLVPGGGIYRAMSYALARDAQMFLTTFFETFGIAVALAVGAMISSSAFRMLYTYLRQLHRRRHPRGEQQTPASEPDNAGR